MEVPRTVDDVGSLLREMRTATGWSLGALAQRAGVSKAALSQWESGLRQPRIPELEATLEALRAAPAQRARVFACMEAPRALRYLKIPSATAELGPLPSASDLLRAMRLRGGWTQEQVAARLGVGQNTVARWEQGERLPSSAQMQALCFALEAHEEEIVALTSGRFAEADVDVPTEPEQVSEYLCFLLNDLQAELADLRFFTLERTLWQRALRGEQTQSLLARTYAEHAHYLSLRKRWEEVTQLTNRALALTPPQGQTPDYALRAVLKQAEALVYGGHRLAPERGLRLLQSWFSQSSQADYTAWFLSDMGEYMALAGRKESGVNLTRQAVEISQVERDMRLLDHGRLLVAAGRSSEALDQLPFIPESITGMFVYEALTRCEALLNLGKTEEASQWVQRAYAAMGKNDLKWHRAEADALAKRLIR